ncbi:hypothetical protein [Seleniivibrio woodruffii]|uniref:Acetyltransferase (GNAT) family protein n=1 Tax=Seleniivibrio woodruffii TaxID=1078050 RepID=A0A4V6NEH5_9BACT|nr:hypothetical protein [Seleniivibrio woodruffii]TCK62291.1 hypothetical protein C8D98_0813 [Seleniivibrio woodruffii]TVZ34591.1 hypothetical protein OF66_0180 [Seleniivibrio woodruffii]
MSKEKNSDIRLLKLINKVGDTRKITMGYMLYQSEVIRTNTEVTYNITFQPIARTGPEGEAEQMPEISEVSSGLENEFKKDNRLTAIADLLTRTIRFPHINRFKLSPAYRGYGLGTYAMNELASQLKGSFPDFAVESVYFYFDSKREDDDRGSFFSFMEKFGFTFSFDDENNNKGLLNMTKAEDFRISVRKDKCVEIELAPFIRTIFRERDEFRQELGRIKAEYKKNNTFMNKFEKDQAIKFLTNVIIALVLLLIMFFFI